MQRKNAWRLGASAIAILCLSATGVAAEEAPADGGEAALEVETVVVTARKRPERLQDVPVSVNVVSGEVLAQRNIGNVQELAKYVPNFTVAATPNNPAPYIRGVGSSAATFSFDQTVGTFVDGVFVGRPRAMMSALFDIEAIEVLRGPQGALLGKNTTAGALNITTRRPTETPQAGLTLTGNVVGARGLNAEGYVSGPIAGDLTGRLAVQYDGQRGSFENLSKGGREPRTDNLFWRGQLAWRPSERLSTRLKLEGGSVDTAGYPVSTELSLITERPDWKFRRSTTPSVLDRDRGNMVTAALTADYEITDDITLTSTSSYSFYKYTRLQDTDFVVEDKYRSHFGERFERYSQELRLASPGGERLNWIVGFAIDDTKLSITQGSTVIFAPVYNGTQFTYYDQDGASWSAFAQADYRIFDRLKITVGLRESYDRKSAVLTRSRTGAVLPTWSLVSPLADKRHESSFDPSVQLQYSFSDDAMVYASYGRGSKAGGFVSNSHTVANLRQFEVLGEEVDGYEAGGKFQLLDRRMSLNLAVFENQFTNLQTATYEQAPPGCGCYIVGNAGAVTVKGVEAELVWRLNPDFTLQGSGSYLDAKYDSYPNTSCRYDPVTRRVPAGLCDLSGERLSNSVKWSGTVSLTMDKPIRDDLRLTGALVVAYKSGTYAASTLVPASYTPAGANVDLRLGLARDGWEVAVIGKNLTDRRVSTNTFQPPLATTATATTRGQWSGFLEPPRTIGLQLRLVR